MQHFNTIHKLNNNNSTTVTGRTCVH